MTIDALSSAGPRPAVNVSNTPASAGKVVDIRRSERPAPAEAPTPSPAEVAAELQRRQQAEDPGQDVSRRVDELNDLTQSIRRTLQFQVDEDTGSTVITVKDTESGEVIRQIPSEELLALTRRMTEISEKLNDVKGVLLSAEA